MKMEYRYAGMDILYQLVLIRTETVREKGRLNQSESRLTMRFRLWISSVSAEERRLPFRKIRRSLCRFPG